MEALVEVAPGCVCRSRSSADAQTRRLLPAVAVPSGAARRSRRAGTPEKQHEASSYVVRMVACAPSAQAALPTAQRCRRRWFCLLSTPQRSSRAATTYSLTSKVSTSGTSLSPDAPACADVRKQEAGKEILL